MQERKVEPTKAKFELEKVKKVEKSKTTKEIITELTRKTRIQIKKSETILYNLYPKQKQGEETKKPEEKENVFLSKMKKDTKILDKITEQISELFLSQDFGELENPIKQRILELENQLKLAELKEKIDKNHALTKEISKIKSEIKLQQTKLEDLKSNLLRQNKNCLKLINTFYLIKKVIERSKDYKTKIKILCTEEEEIMIFDYNIYGKIMNFKEFFDEYPEK